LKRSAIARRPSIGRVWSEADRSLWYASQASTCLWRRHERAKTLGAIAAKTRRIPWCPSLVRLPLEKLCVDADAVTELVASPRKMKRHQYAQAVAMAVVLRHSWRADDLAGRRTWVVAI
jgi:hypothetical protein